MKRELVAHRDPFDDSYHVWNISEHIHLITADMKVISVYHSDMFRFSLSHKEAQEAFNAWLYPYGTVLRDDSNKAKIERIKQAQGDYTKDISLPPEPM